MSTFVSFASWPIQFKVLTFNVTIVLIHLSDSSCCLSSVADFSNTGARARISAERTHFLPARWAMRFGHMLIFRWLYFNLINRRHPYR